MKRFIAIVMAAVLLLSVFVFYASARDEIEVETLAEFIAAIDNSPGAKIILARDLIVNDHVTCSYDEESKVITVEKDGSVIATVPTGENEAEATGSLESLLNWVPLENLNGCEIDGAGHAIVGLYINVTSGIDAAFVRAINMDESVKDLRFIDSLVISDGSNRTATLAGVLYGDVSGVTVENGVVFAKNVKNYGGAAGVIQRTYSPYDSETLEVQHAPVVDGVTFYGTVLAHGVNNVSTGGIICQSIGGIVRNCANYGTVKTVGGTTYAAGGIIGLVEPTHGTSKAGDNGPKAHQYVLNCANYGAITGNKANRSGGISGFVDPYWSSGEDVVLHNLYNAGEITNGGEFFGYIQGIDKTATIGEASVTYAFAPEKETFAPGSVSTKFTKLSVAAPSTAKALKYLNHGATAYEGLRLWTKDDEGTPVFADEYAGYDEAFEAKDITEDVDFGIVSAVRENDSNSYIITFTKPACIAVPSRIWRRMINPMNGTKQTSGTSVEYLGDDAQIKDGKKYSSIVRLTFAEAPEGFDFTKYGLSITEYGINDKETDDGYVSAKVVVSIDGDLLEKNHSTDTEDFYWIPSDGADADNVYTPHLTVGEAYVDPDTVVELTAISAKVLNEKEIELKFSEGVSVVERVWASIRYTDANFNLRRDESLEDPYLQWGVGLRHNGSDTIIATYSGETPLADILAKKGYEDKDYLVTICIEGLPSDKLGTQVVGYLDQIQTPDGSKMVLANKSSSGGVYDDVYLVIGDVENATVEFTEATPLPDPAAQDEDFIKVVSAAKITGKDAYVITFSEPVHIFAPSRIWRRMGNMNNGTKQASGTTVDYIGSDKETVDGADYSTVVRINYPPFEDGFDTEKYGIAFTEYGINNKETDDGLISAKVIAGKDGKLLGTNFSSANEDFFWIPTAALDTADEYGVHLTEIEETSDSLELISAKVLNEKEIELTFSGPVTLVSNVWACIRYTDTSYNLQRDESLEDPYLQWGVGLRYNGSNKMIANYSGTKATLADLLAKKGYESKNYLVTICIEGLPSDKLGTQIAGYLDQIQSPDGKKMLVANKPNSKGVYDGVYAVIGDAANAENEFTEATPLPEPELPENPEIPIPEGVRVVSAAKIIGKNVYVLTFSEPVHVFAPSRIWRRMGNMHNGTKQASGTGVEYVGSDKETVDGVDYSTVVRISYPEFEDGFDTVKYGLSITEYGLNDKETDDGFISAKVIVGKGGKLLGKNYASDTEDFIWIPTVAADTANEYGVHLTEVEDTGEEEEKFELISAKVLNEKEIELTFSGPATLVSNVWACIRYTNSEFTLQTDKSLEDPYLQWGVGLRYNGSNKFIANYSGTKATLADLLNKKGYEDKNYLVTICMEGLPSDKLGTQVAGYLDQVQSPDGTKLLVANKPNPNGIYDGVYAVIEDIENATVEFTTATPLPEPEIPENPDIPVPEGIRVVSAAKIIGKDAYILTFSEPVHVFAPSRIWRRMGNMHNGTKQASGTTVSYVGDDAETVDGKVYSTVVRIDYPPFEDGFDTEKYGLSITEYGLNDKETDDGFISAKVISGKEGKLLGKNYASNTEDFIWIPTVAADTAHEYGVHLTEVEETTESLELLSAKVLNEKEIELTFSDSAKLVSNVWACIRYTDTNYNLQRDESLEDPYLQWGVGLRYNGSNKFIATYNGTKATLSDILNKKGYESKNYYVTLCMEGLPSTTLSTQLTGYLDQVQSPDGKKLLFANKPNPNGVYDGVYVIIGDIENATKPFTEATPLPEITIELNLDPVNDGISIISAKVTSPTRIELKFSEPVSKVGRVFTAIRYVDDKLALQRDNSLSDPNLQFYGTLSLSGTDTGYFDYTGSTSMYDVLKFKGYEGKPWAALLCIEGLDYGDNVPEYIDGIQGAEGKMLSCNKPSSKGVYDGYYVAIDDIEKAYAEPVGPEGALYILSAKVLNEKEIELTFDTPAYLVGNVWSCIRYTNSDFALQTDKTREDPYLQWGVGLRMNGSDKAIIKYNRTDISLADLLACKGYEDKGYLVTVCIEGLPGDAIKTPFPGYVDNVRSVDDKYLLFADKENKGGVYDGSYTEIEDVENATKPFTEDTKLPPSQMPVKPIKPETLKATDDGVQILSVKVLNSTQLQITFSEPIQRVAGSTWNCIRYVDANLTLKRDETKADPYLQFGGSFTVNGNIGTWTLNNQDKGSLSDILNKKGYEDSGYHVTFCMEGLAAEAIKNPKPGYIDNFATSKGKLLAANKTSPGGVYDGYYALITNLENLKIKGPTPGSAPSVEIKNRPHFTAVECRVINPSQIEVIFSEPAKMAGSVFSAIRYTNESKQLQRDEKRNDPYLQYSGGLSLVAGSARAVWTLGGSSSKTLYEILHLSGYEKSGYKVYFCIEGLSYGANEPGYIDSIQSEDGKKLLKCDPEKASAGGVYDGVYLPIQNVEKAEAIDVVPGNMDELDIVEIRAIDNYTLEFEFAENIILVGSGTATTQYNPVAASVRFVNPANYETLVIDGTVMEFAADFYAEDGTPTATFELRSKNYPLRQLFDIHGFDAVKEAGGIAILCLEGTPDDDGYIEEPVIGFIDNIQSEDGTKMLMAQILSPMGVADLWFATVDDINFDAKKGDSGIDISKLVDETMMSSAEREAYAALDEAVRTERLNKAAQLLNNMRYNEMTETGDEAFEKLLKQNGIDNPETVKAFKFTTGESLDVGFPIRINANVKERAYDMNDALYVYRVNEDGTVEQIDRSLVKSYVADGVISRVEFYDDKLGDYFVTNSPLEIAKAGAAGGIAGWLIGAGAAAVAVIAAIIALIFAKKKKKKEAK